MKFVLRTILAISLSSLLAACVSPLYQASARGDINTVKKLLETGSNVNERGGGGLLNDSHALDAASLSGHTEIVKLLLSKGADVNAAHGTMGWTPLSSAAWHGHTDIVNLLIDNGADINKAISALDKGVGTNGAIELLRNVKRERVAKQPVPPKVSTEIPQVADVIRSDVDEIPSKNVKQNRNSYAIVIGIEKYRQKLPRADHATHDATIVSGYLTKSMGYPEENVVTLLDDRALKSDLEKYFDRWLSNNVEENGKVFIYFSGHGAPNIKTGDAYLVPYDGDPTFIAETGYPLARLYASLGKLKAKEIVVVLDSCFSGSGGRSVLAKGAKPLVVKINGPIIPKNITVLTASSGDQISSAYEEKGHGLFTYFLLKGIKNEDVLKPDGAIGIGDLFSYVKPQVERIARKQYNNEQTPQLLQGNVAR